MMMEGKTRAGEELRMRVLGKLIVIELKSPVHGRWMVVAEHADPALAATDFECWKN